MRMSAASDPPARVGCSASGAPHLHGVSRSLQEAGNEYLRHLNVNSLNQAHVSLPSPGDTALKITCVLSCSPPIAGAYAIASRQCRVSRVPACALPRCSERTLKCTRSSSRSMRTCPAQPAVQGVAHLIRPTATSRPAAGSLPTQCRWWVAAVASCPCPFCGSSTSRAGIGRTRRNRSTCHRRC
jgi:hypothetical protein